SDPRQAVWLVPTEAFQRQTYRSRGDWVEQGLSQCSDPDQAFENWMARDADLARGGARSAAAFGLDALTGSGEQSVEEGAQGVARLFGLADVEEGCGSTPCEAASEPHLPLLRGAMNRGRTAP